MRKSVIIATVCLALVVLYCGGKKKESQDGSSLETSTRSVSAEQKVEELNQVLSGASLSGFPGWKASVDKASLDLWAASAKSAIERAIAEVPEGYKVAIVGHANRRGPKSRNDAISRSRARWVLRALKRQKIDTSKVKAIGVGYSEPATPEDPEDAANRRVTFRVQK